MRKFLMLALALCAVNGVAQSSASLPLSGRVTLPSENASPATVMVISARLKPDALASLADRHPRLPRRAQTDRQGNFKIESLDPGWLYFVVMVAPGSRPAILDPVDLAADPLKATLTAVDVSQIGSGTALRGVVKDTSGKPVSGAVIRTQEVTRNNIWDFSPREIDAFAVSDDTGHFVIYGQTPFTDAGGAIEADGYATELFEHWPPGDVVHTVTLREGAAVEGRLVNGGAPVVNAEVHLGNFGAEAGSSVWNYSGLTDAQGRFSFAHLPPNRPFSLYATMGSLGEQGALSKLPRRTLESGSTNKLGDLSLAPAHRVEGRILLADGKPIPALSHVTLTRMSMAGSQDALSRALDQDGTFRFAGVPAEKATIYFRVPGYEISPKDRQLKSGSATNLVVAGNITNLVIRMQPQARN